MAARRLQGRMNVQGLEISIENRKGGVRRGVDKDGHPWATKMACPYGYIRLSDEVRRIGDDKEHLDCFVGPDPESDSVFIIHLMHADDRSKFDEDKCLIGFSSRTSAMKCFKVHYDKVGRALFGGMTELSMDAFKNRLKVQSQGMIKSLVHVILLKARVRQAGLVEKSLAHVIDIGLLRKRAV